MAQEVEKEETHSVVSPLSVSSDALDTPSHGSSASEQHEPRHIKVPEHGRRAWLVVLGGFVNFTASFGLLNSFGTFESEYETTLRMSTSTVTWIGSAQMFVLFISGILIGPAFDKWGARKLMLLGTFFCLVSMVACSFTTRFYQILLFQGFLFGSGCALLAVSQWFDKRRGLALGVVVSGASAGGILWPIVLSHLLMRFGIQWTHRAAAAIATPLLLFACALVRECPDRAGPGIAEIKIAASRTFISEALWDVRFLGLSVSLLFINCGVMVPFFYIPQYAKEHGVSGTMANNLLAISYAASLIGRISTGWVADNVGRFNMLLFMCTLTGVACICLIWATSMSTLVLFSLFFGFSSGGILPLGSACVAQTTPRMGYIGLRIGAMMAICSVGTLAGGPVTGAIKDATQNWAGVFIFCGAVLFGGTGILFTVRMAFEKRLAFVF